MSHDRERRVSGGGDRVALVVVVVVTAVVRPPQRTRRRSTQSPDASDTNSQVIGVLVEANASGLGDVRRIGTYRPSARDPRFGLDDSAWPVVAPWWRGRLFGRYDLGER
jgi:hypothetical protein